MRLFLLLIFLLVLFGCNQADRQKAVWLNKELAATPILSQRFDSLVQEARGLPERNRLSVLLPVATRKGENLKGKVKQEPLLLEALPLASKKERKQILFCLINCYELLCSQKGVEEKGIARCDELISEYSLSMREEWTVKRIKAALLMSKRQMAESLPIFYELLSEHRAKDEHRLVIDDLLAISVQYNALGDQEKSIAVCKEAYQLAVEKQFGELRKACVGNLINNLFDSGWYAEAVAYTKENKLDADSLLTPSFCIFLANCYLKLNTPDTSRFYLERHMELVPKLMSKTFSYARIAETYMAEGREDSATLFLDKAMVCFQEYSTGSKQSSKEKKPLLPDYFIPIYTNYALLLQRNGKPEKALEAYRQIEPLVKRHTNSKPVREDQISALLHLASFYRDINNYKESADLLMRRDSLQQMNEKIKEERNSKAIIDRFKSQELVSAFQIQSIELRSSHRVLLLVGVFVLLLSCSLVVLLLMYRRGRQQLSALFLKDEEIRILKGEPAEATGEGSDVMRELFGKAEERVSSGKLFLNKELSLEMLAHELDTNRSYLSSCINTCSGNNFSQWINNYRVNYILTRMHQTDDLARLADESGFVSRASFYRNFKLYTQLTPRQYLEKIQKEEVY